jgi:hypothetical protein
MKMALESSLVKEKLNTTSIPNKVSSYVLKLHSYLDKVVSINLEQWEICTFASVKMHFEPQLMAIDFL